MKKNVQAFVKFCKYYVSPKNHESSYIKMEVFVKNQIFSFTITDPNWVYFEGKIDYDQFKPKVKEMDKYKIHPRAFDLTTKTNATMTDIEQELALSYVFEHCGKEMTRIRQDQEEKMMIMFGMSDEALSVFSKEELEKLSERYEVKIN